MNLNTVSKEELYNELEKLKNIDDENFLITIPYFSSEHPNGNVINQINFIKSLKGLKYIVKNYKYYTDGREYLIRDKLDFISIYLSNKNDKVLNQDGIVNLIIDFITEFIESKQTIIKNIEIQLIINLLINNKEYGKKFIEYDNINNFIRKNKCDKLKNYSEFRKILIKNRNMGLNIMTILSAVFILVMVMLIFVV